MLRLTFMVADLCFIVQKCVQLSSVYEDYLSEDCQYLQTEIKMTCTNVTFCFM